MSLKFNFKNLYKSDYIVDGVDLDLSKYKDEIEKAHQSILERRANNILGFYDLPEKNCSRINSYIDKIGSDFDNIVVLGIGGSALGNKALYSALRIEKGLHKKLFVADNVDPTLIYDILSQIELKRTLFNVVTKSGTTAETMSIFMIVLKILKEAFPDDYKRHIVVTTDKEKGFLRKVLQDEGYYDFDVPDNVGGRFSVFTDVGLLSSAFVGIDIEKLLHGAKTMRDMCETSDIENNPAYLLGLIHYIYMKEGKNISVMMPYSNALYDMADWYRQLWAESLGKKFNLKGEEVFVGQTPVKALGTTDQHSQVQLYREGPNDKVFTFLTVENFKHDYLIPHLYMDRDEVNYLAGQSISTLLNTERLATEIALTKSQRANCNIMFPQINEENLGEFVMLYEIMTLFTGALLEINPLDQPGVEEGKIATYALMGKKGYTKEKEEIEEMLK
ncbi:MAG: glucose-6-phosphate isomerase [Candidatus Cloacimonetes bacterium 4572_65]|nr:MAG: glucose-6-phosphate isomerase [Candidatus Cloacimonetes bacterium 4572_65]